MTHTAHSHRDRVPGCFRCDLSAAEVAMEVPNIVTRRDFTNRSRVTLQCRQRCGTTVVHCDIADADIYEAGFREHLCRIADLQPGERPALRRMLAHMAGEQA